MNVFSFFCLHFYLVFKRAATIADRDPVAKQLAEVSQVLHRLASVRLRKSFHLLFLLL